MLALRLVLFLSLLGLALGCGKSSFQVNHDLPSIPPTANRQLSTACIEANSEVGAAITPLRATKAPAGLAVNFNQAQILPDGSCAVVVQLNDHTQALPLVAAIKSQLGNLDSYVATSNGDVPLWIDELHHPANSSQNKPGQTFDPSVTVAQCQWAGQQLKAHLPPALNVTVSVQNNPATTGPNTIACYVQAAFATNADYESFLVWTNPLSKENELFHIDCPSADGTTVVATVWIHAYSAQVTP